MKLLFLTASLGHGGAERHTVTLVNKLAERGHECHLAYLKDDAAQLERLRGAASAQCLHARRYLDLKALRTLRRLVRQLGPTVLVAVNQYPLLYASLARRRAALAVTFHSTFMRNAKERLQMLAYRPLFWAADCAVFMCEAQRRHWVQRGVFARSNAVIHNGVDAAYWRPAAAREAAAVRRVLGLAEDDYVIGMPAVLRPEKNPLLLVHAIERLRHAGLPARALMIGDGEMRPAVEELARRLGIAQAVSVTGLQQDVRPFLAACDAVALGRPVVHAQVGGAAELIRHADDGFLFPVGDGAALAGRLAELAEPGLRRRMGARARLSVETRFTEAAMLDRYEAALSQLATTRSKHGNLRKPAGAH